MSVHPAFFFGLSDLKTGRAVVQPLAFPSLPLHPMESHPKIHLQ
jgi:hypothetical protein